MIRKHMNHKQMNRYIAKWIIYKKYKDNKIGKIIDEWIIKQINKETDLWIKMNEYKNKETKWIHR